MAHRKRTSNRNFTRNALRTHVKNVARNPMRGGIRL